jgi:hypothetical protein
VYPNGKHYIGLTTTSLEKRTKQHKNAANRGNAYLVCKAIRKYGMVDTLELLEVDTADTIEELCEKEIKYITEYDSYYRNGKGYNMTYGGEGTNGHVCTEEVKQKISKSLSGHVCTEKSKQKMSKAASKRFEKPEVREQMSKAASKRFEKPEVREQMSKSQKKRFKNPKARQQLSEAHIKFHLKNPDAAKQNGERCRKRLKENPEERRKSSDGKGKNKPFDVFTIDGTFVKTFTYQFEAKEYLQKKYCITTNILISNVLKGRRKSSKGFVFKYK